MFVGKHAGQFIPNAHRERQLRQDLPGVGDVGCFGPALWLDRYGSKGYRGSGRYAKEKIRISQIGVGAAIFGREALASEKSGAGRRNTPIEHSLDCHAKL